MVFWNIHEFLNDAPGSRKNSSTQTNKHFFSFPWILTSSHLARVTLFRACLFNLKNLDHYAQSTNENQINHPHRTPLHATLHYTLRNFVWWLFSYMTGQVTTCFFLKSLPATELSWQDACLLFITIQFSNMLWFWIAGNYWWKKPLYSPAEV